MPADRRIKKGAVDTLTAYFYDGGETPIDKGAVTVSVASDIGTVLQTGSATNTSGTYTFALTTASTVAIDLLTVTWTSGTETLKTQVEIVGGFYFELPDLRAMQDLSNSTTYNTERLRASRRWIEDIIDTATNTCFVRRYARDTFAASPMTTPVVILRKRLNAKALLTVNVAGTAVSLSGIQLDPYNRLVVTQGYPWLLYGFGVVDVRYEAAYTDTCPGDLREAALQAARFRLIQTDGASGIPNRATSMTNEFGNVQLSTAGKNRPTGIPDVDAVINSYVQQTKQPGLA